ncbi:hypothetical protein CP532_0565 [Ophiocordyceps camponoti-leonardi (nom. inval.)]|nr:hypothetical protein CP532_0565 [Ophiocordyceps camponoti-leonardi (nom. inval.)]
MSVAAAKRAREDDGDDEDDDNDGDSNFSYSSYDGKAPKRAKLLTGARPRHHHQSAAIDPTWGQKYVFSGAADVSTIPYGEEADFEDDSEAMAYLRAVRCEASGLPHLKIAPVVEIGPQLPAELRSADEVEDHDDDDDGGGHGKTAAPDEEPCCPSAYYDDGAYVAEPGDDAHDDSDTFNTEFHHAYFASLLTRYLGMRRVLHAQPPSDAACRLPPSRPTSVGPGRHGLQRWSDLIRSTDPLPLQLALMTKRTVLRLLRLFSDGPFLRRGLSLTERTSRWLWALLARLPPPGELNHYEFSCVRELGLRAAYLGTSEEEAAALRALGEDANAITLDGPYYDGDTLDNDDDDHDPLSVEDAASPEDNNPDTRHDTESVEMDLSSDNEADALQAAKSALLSRLETDQASPASKSPPRPPPPAAANEAALALNKRATLDMLLTVTGEYYGQRDLLDFRDPFGS